MFLRCCFLFCFLIRQLIRSLFLILLPEIHPIRIHLIELFSFFFPFYGSSCFLISKLKPLFLLRFLTATILLSAAVPSALGKFHLFFFQSSRFRCGIFLLSGNFSRFPANHPLVSLFSALLSCLLFCSCRSRCISGILYRGADIFSSFIRFNWGLIRQVKIVLSLFPHLYITGTTADTNRRFFCQVFFHKTVFRHLLDFLIPDFHSLFCQMLLLLYRVSFPCL